MKFAAKYKTVSVLSLVAVLICSFVLTGCGGATGGKGGSDGNTGDNGENENMTTTVYDLKTDDMTDPVGIDSIAPEFGWKMSSDGIGQKQTAYKITVWDANGKVVWDSGKVVSDKSVDIAYAGDDLRPSGEYKWEVKVWDMDGKSVVSDVAYFEMGLIDKHAFDDAVGTEVKIEHGEMLNDNNGERSRGNDGPGGSVYNLNYRSAAATTRYILGGGKESYNPLFTFYGFRYIEITATDTVTFENITGEVVTSVESQTGSVVTSDEKINRLVQNTVWGQISNYLSVPSDCPQRDERYGWTGDVQVFAETGCYLGFSKSFLTKYMQDLRDVQAEDGTIPGAAPTGQADGWGYGGTGWSDVLIILPHTLYRMYDDISVVKENWNAMCKYTDVFLAGTDGFGPRPYWGDWLSYEDNGDQVREMLGVAYYAYDAMLMSKMATALGLETDAARYAELYRAEKQFFIDRYVKPDGELIRSEQSVCLYALYLDLLPNAESVAAVSKQLTDNFARNGNKLQTGFLGTKIILDTLTRINRTDIAYDILLQEDNPSWLYSVLQGATTIWERWNSYTIENGFGDVGMNSFNHYSYGAVVGWMFRNMGGINSAANGFKSVLFAPEPTQRIPTVECIYESVYGKIAANSTLADGTWTYTVTLPANTDGIVKLPITNVSGVTVNGKAAAELDIKTDGAVYDKTENGCVYFKVVSGKYAFAIEWER